MLTRFVVWRMQGKPRGRRAWFRWYAVYRALPHWQLLRRRVYRNGCMRSDQHGCVGPLHAHHKHYRSLGREKIGIDVICLCSRHHVQMHGRHQ